MSTYFISDIHLTPDNDFLTDLFLDFLQNRAGQADALYILGDLFEVWIGDDNCNSFNNRIISALRTFTQTGIPLFFLPGNRDFLIGKKFAKVTGCTLLQGPTIINLYGESILVLHGDSLCTHDQLHQLFRRTSNHPIIKNLFLTLPLKGRQWIAKKIRTFSKKRTFELDHEIMDVTPTLIPSLFKKYNVLTVIHGHTHRPSIEYLPWAGELRRRIVLSDWERHGNILVCSSRGEKRLIYFQ